MAWSRVDRVKNGRAAIAYLLGDGKGHNGNEVRNAEISCVNMIPDGEWLRQFQKEWNRVNREKHPTQAVSVIMSFSRNEFDPENPEHIAAARDIGIEFVKEHYPNRRALICTQIDGQSALIHNHLLISDADMDTLHGCTKEQYHSKQVERWVDDTVSKYTTLDRGDKAKDIGTRTERARREKGEYVYKDDIRQRVVEAMQEADSEDDFIERLSANGVTAEKKTSKKRGKYYTYDLTDLSNKPESVKLTTTKARSYKLGDGYSPEAIRDVIAARQAEAQSVDNTTQSNAEAPQSDSDITGDKISVVEEKPVKMDLRTFRKSLGDWFRKDGSVDPEKYNDIYTKYKRYVNGEELETVTPEPVSEPDENVEIFTAPVPVSDDEDEAERRQKRDGERRKAIRQETAQARHKELIKKFGTMTSRTAERDEEYEL